jgi:hypothetical protein
MIPRERLTPQQLAVSQTGGRCFLLGPAGSGKTTALHQRLLRILADGTSAYTILALVSERSHTLPFLQAVHEAGLGPYAELEITTYQHLAREMVTLFWPLVARPAGFGQAHQPPTFLTYDLAQLLMWRIVRPMAAEGAFADVRLRPQQVVSQLLDTLNRAALNRLTLDEALARQRSTYAGPPDQLRRFEEAARAAHEFRRVCLSTNLLDLSLLVQVFDTQLVQHEAFRRYFSERFLHLLVDNVEEQTPAGQSFIAGLMEFTATAAIAYDAGGGYKRFLAADPAGANQFARRCETTVAFEDSLITTTPLVHLANLVENTLMGTRLPSGEAAEAVGHIIHVRYRHEMVSHLVDYLTELVREVPPREIALVAPYLDGVLRYNLVQALRECGLPHRLLRRRHIPREEPRVRAWLTWLVLAHPGWGIKPVPYDVSEALTLSIARMDPARAQLVSGQLYLPAGPTLLPVAEMSETVAQRVGDHLLDQVELLRQWLDQEGHDRHRPDVFLHRLFHGLLSQPSFQPEPDLAAAAVCDWLVRTAGRVRLAAAPMGLDTPAEIGRTLIEGIYEGLVTANPPDLGEPPDPEGITIATVYGYLIGEERATVQVWLEAGATGWWDLPRQPLSNPFVLAQSWRPDRLWTAVEEFEMRDQLLSRLIRGLTRRCAGSVVLAHSDLDRRGLHQEGRLWRALLPVRRKDS